VEAFDLKPRNVEQRLALDLLLDPEVAVVALDGPAGTGKTLLAIAAGLEQVWNHPPTRRYERLAIYRPIVAVGRQDVGYLPGTLEEKLDPWTSLAKTVLTRPAEGTKVVFTGDTSQIDARSCPPTTTPCRC